MAGDFYLTDVVDECATIVYRKERGASAARSEFSPKLSRVLVHPKQEKAALLQFKHNNAKVGDFSGDVTTAVKVGTVVHGSLRFAEPVRINGNVGGKVESTSLVILGEMSEVSADMRVDCLVVYGQMTGNAFAKTSVLVMPGGCVLGEVCTPELVVKSGGIFEGRALGSGQQ